MESFVDESQYRGTCYRACGFAAVGATGGFARDSRDFYLPHGVPKQLYLRELCPRARQRLRQARLPAELAVHEADLAGRVLSAPRRSRACSSVSRPCPTRGAAMG